MRHFVSSYLTWKFYLGWDLYTQCGAVYLILFLGIRKKIASVSYHNRATKIEEIGTKIKITRAGIVLPSASQDFFLFRRTDVVLQRKKSNASRE